MFHDEDGSGNKSSDADVVEGGSESLDVVLVMANKRVVDSRADEAFGRSEEETQEDETVIDVGNMEVELGG